jgi:hypothetical protein
MKARQNRKKRGKIAGDMHQRTSLYETQSVHNRAIFAYCYMKKKAAASERNK